VPLVKRTNLNLNLCSEEYLRTSQLIQETLLFRLLLPAKLKPALLLYFSELLPLQLQFLAVSPCLQAQLTKIRQIPIKDLLLVEPQQPVLQPKAYLENNKRSLKTLHKLIKDLPSEHPQSTLQMHLDSRSKMISLRVLYSFQNQAQTHSSLVSPLKSSLAGSANAQSRILI